MTAHSLTSRCLFQFISEYFTSGLQMGLSLTAVIHQNGDQDLLLGISYGLHGFLLVFKLLWILR